jgi:hypothetical protein
LKLGLTPRAPWYRSAIEWNEKNEQHAVDEWLRQDLERFRDQAAQLVGMKPQPIGTERQKPGEQAPGR